MKKILFTALCIIAPLMIQAQSDSLKNAYKQLCATLKDYKFVSQDAEHGDGKTLSITFKVQKGMIILTIRDDFGAFNDPVFGYKAGTKILRVPVAEVQIRSRYSWGDGLKLAGKDGIEFEYKGKKEIIEGYVIGGENLTVKKLKSELETFIRIAQSESFDGILGGSTSAKSAPKSKPATKSSQPSPQQQQRKRIPSGN